MLWACFPLRNVQTHCRRRYRLMSGGAATAGCKSQLRRDGAVGRTRLSPTRIWTVSSPSPASLASMVNSTGRLAATPEALRPGPLARTLLASWAGKVLILKGLKGGRLGGAPFK